MKIRPVQKIDHEEVVSLTAKFRIKLSQFRGKTYTVNLAAAKEELAEYQNKGYPIFVAESKDLRIVGYLVCRVDGDVVWAESLFVLPECRRKGIGSALYAQAERLAQELGGDTVYNWIHPNNDRIISFLQKRGYNVLNLIEVRRARLDENTILKIRVGKHKYKY